MVGAGLVFCLRAVKWKKRFPQLTAFGPWYQSIAHTNRACNRQGLTLVYSDPRMFQYVLAMRGEVGEGLRKQKVFMTPCSPLYFM